MSERFFYGFPFINWKRKYRKRQKTIDDSANLYYNEITKYSELIQVVDRFKTKGLDL